MDRDGAKCGFDIELTRSVADAVGVPVIASGGVGELDHLVAAFGRTRQRGARASIFHFGEYSISRPSSIWRGGHSMRLDGLEAA